MPMRGSMRVLFAFSALIGSLMSLPLAAYGWLLWLTSGGCDTNCPTDAELVAGKVLAFGGPLLFAGSVFVLALMLRVR